MTKERFDELKIGDYVTVKSLDDILAECGPHREFGGICFVEGMDRFCGETAKVIEMESDTPYVDSDGSMTPIVRLDGMDGYCFSSHMLTDDVKRTFHIEDYSGLDYAVHCDTLEKVRFFRSFLGDNEKCNIDRIVNSERDWNAHREKTCINVSTGNYSDESWYKLEGYNILEFDDFFWDGLPQTTVVGYDWDEDDANELMNFLAFSGNGVEYVVQS